MAALRILHVLGYSIPNMSGYTIRSKYLIESEVKQGVYSTVITSPKYTHEEPFQSKASYGNVLYHRTKFGYLNIQLPLFKEILLIGIFRKKIKEIVEEEHIDIIHAHSPSINGLASLNIRRSGKKVPLIYHVRALWEDAGVESGKMKEKSVKYRLSSIVENKLLENADGVVTICQGLKRELMSRGISEEKICVIENGVDTSFFSPSSPVKNLVDRFKIDGKIIVGFVGSFFKFEGVVNLIEAFEILIKAGAPVKLFLIGDGEEFANIRNEIERRNLSNFVIMTGRVTHSSIIEYYSIIDILVYPRVRSRLTELVTPLKPLEALSIGKAVVGSDVGGIKELIKNEVTGLIYPAESISRLADAILKLVNDPDLRLRLGRNGMEEVRRERQWSIMTKRMISFYDDVLKYRR